MSKKLVLVSCFIGVSLYAAEPAMPLAIFSAANGKEQQDRAIAIPLKDKLFLGMYDGHSGSNTANLLQSDLHKHLQKYISKHSVEKAFQKAVTKVDNKARQQYFDGSTAVAAYIEDGWMHVINVGDSRLILEKNGKVDFSTQDHIFENETEKARVIDKEGLFFRFVDRETRNVTRSNPWRLNGLAPLRTIGDKWAKGGGSRTFESRGSGDREFVYQIYKTNNDEKTYDIVRDLTITPQKGQVIADPEYTKICLTEENRWLILATDGLTNVLSNDEIVECVVQYAQDGMSQGKIVELLIQQAIERNSRDNITVMICDLLQLKKR